MTKIIAFSGYAGTGKNTIASELTEQLWSKGVVGLYQLAGPGKAAVANVLGVDISALEDKDWRSTYPVPYAGKEETPIDLVRIILEGVATNGHPSIWAELLLNKIKQDNFKYAIITDLRRTRELDIFKDIDDFYHFHVTRNIELTDTHDHISESEVENMGAKATCTYDLVLDTRTIVTDMMYKLH